LSDEAAEEVGYFLLEGIFLRTKTLLTNTTMCSYWPDLLVSQLRQSELVEHCKNTFPSDIQRRLLATKLPSTQRSRHLISLSVTTAASYRKIFKLRSYLVSEIYSSANKYGARFWAPIGLWTHHVLLRTTFWGALV
jgi:hypothetical protein